jgi:hypothetical protein
MTLGVGAGVSDDVGERVGVGDSVGAAVRLGVALRATDVTGAHALARMTTMMNDLTELP